MKEYHILSLSGGKDSTALAFFMKEKMPEIFENLELVFCDTECDLPETYDYLNKIEIFLGKKITRIKPKYNFEHYFNIYKIIPSAMKRWCTTEMKTKTFQKFIKKKIQDKNKIYVYIGIRADESSRVDKSNDTDNFSQVYPFVEYTITKSEVNKILEQVGIGLPKYYEWRSRSGCYFCFFQKKIEWINLLERHPQLFEKALYFEKSCGKNFTWCQDTTLENLKEISTIRKIKASYKNKNKSALIKNNLITTLF